MHSHFHSNSHRLASWRASFKALTLQGACAQVLFGFHARRSAVAEYVEHCAQRFTVEDEERGGGVKIGLGPNSCPAVLLYHPAGYTAVVRPCKHRPG